MKQRYDAVIVGGGPAGLSAALYLARARFSVLVLEKESWGGQITITAEVVNYPGVYETNGRSLSETMRRQAQRFGASFQVAFVQSINMEGDVKVIHTDKGDIEALGVVLATGANPRKAGFIGEEEFRGQGVAYCATCDGEFFTGKDIYVIGGGIAAVEEALFLTRYGKHIHMIVRGTEFSCVDPAVEEVLEHKDITVHFESEVVAVRGQGKVDEIDIRHKKENRIQTIRAEEKEYFGVFVFAGYEPENRLAQGKLQLDEKGYIITDRQQRTDKDGIYAAGDVCVKELRQVVTAVSDGAVAATDMERWLAHQYRHLGLERKKVVIVEEPKPDVMEEAVSTTDKAFLDKEAQQAIRPVLERMERKLTLTVYEDGQRAGMENRKIVEELMALSPKIQGRFLKATNEEERNCLSIDDEEGKDLGLRFYGVPGGHEFNSFIIALYNAAGPGQAIDASLHQRILGIEKPMAIKIYISLSCTMCPDLVMAAQRIGALHDKIHVSVYDLSYYPEVKEELGIRSVPCMQIQDGPLLFGKKGIDTLVALLEEQGK